MAEHSSCSESHALKGEKAKNSIYEKISKQKKAQSCKLGDSQTEFDSVY